MTTPVLPDYAAPFKPVPNVTPFTLRDGTTMLKKLDGMQKYIQRVLIPWINENFSDLADEFETQVNSLILQVNTALQTEHEFVVESIAAQNQFVNTSIGDLDGKSVETALDELYDFVSAAVASIIGSTIEITGPIIRQVSREEFDPGLVILSADRFPGIVSFTGDVSAAPDVAPAINTALALLPAGAHVKIPAGKYAIRTAIVPPKSVTIDAYGCEFEVDSALPFLTINGGYETIYNATSVTEDRVLVENGGREWGTLVTINSVVAETWKRGDVVRLISDDWIPGARPGNPINIAGITATFTAATDTITTSAAHGLTIGDGVYINAPTPSGATSGIFDKQRYYVKSVPSATTFTVSEDFNGATLNILLDGTSATIDKSDSESRTGQFFDVNNVSNGVGSAVITLNGRLHDPVTTNIRIARLRTDKIVKLHGGKVGRSAAIITAQTAGTLINGNAAYRPELKDVEFGNNIAQTVVMVGCYNYLIDSVRSTWAFDNGSTKFGYGIMDNNSAYGIIRNCLFYGHRHAVSDDTTRIGPNNADPAKYGRTFANKIIGNTAISSTSSAFDTHHASLANEFIDNTVIDGASYAIGLRGRKHVVRGLTVRGARGAINIFTESGGGESWGHRISDIFVDGFISIGVRVSANSGTVDDNPGRLWNVQEKRKNYISNVLFTGPEISPSITGSIVTPVEITNATVRLDNIEVNASGLLADANKLVIIDNSRVHGKRHIFDYRENTGGASVEPYLLQNASNAEIDDIRVKSPFAGFGGRFTRLVSNGATDFLRFTNIILDEYPATAMSGGAADKSVLEFTVIKSATADSMDSSRFATMTEADANSTTATWYTRLRRTGEDYTVVANIGSAVTLAILPFGIKHGQRLTIVNTGVGALTIVHGSGGLTLLTGSANVVLNQFGVINLVWTPTSGGRWRQI